MSYLLSGVKQPDSYFRLKKEVVVITRENVVLLLWPPGGVWLGYPVSYAHLINLLKLGVSDDSPLFWERDMQAIIEQVKQARLLAGNSNSPPIGDVLADSPRLVVINLGSNCNLECSYCYAQAGSNGHKMKEATFEQSLDLIQRSKLEKYALAFAGGEPFLQFDLMRRAVNELATKEVTFAVQTNATLLDQDKVAWIKKYGINVGLSCDGPAHIHNNRRVYPNGKGSLSGVIDGVSRLQESQVKFTTLAVMEKAEDYQDLWEFALQHNMNWVSCNLAENIGRGKGKYTEAGVSHAMALLELFDRSLDLVCEKRKTVFERNLLVAIGHLVSKFRPYMCQRSPCGAGHFKMYINHDGVIYPCSRFAAYPEMCLGDVSEGKTFQQIIKDSSVVTNLRKRTVSNLDCVTCPLRAFCGGGCSASAYSFDGHLHARTPNCRYHQELFLGVMERIVTRYQDVIQYYNASKANYYREG